jgi:parvulin-like peptidyl-prolyl isomerase
MMQAIARDAGLAGSQHRARFSFVGRENRGHFRMVERIRNEFRRITTGESDDGRMSQAELDSYRRQLILLVISVVAIALVLILGIGAYYQYIHLPRQSVATVNGETITRSDYWDYRRYELLNQISQYQQFAQFMEGEQGQQYLQLAAEADREFDNIENASIDPMTVDQMISDRILMDSLDEFGLEITEEEIDERLVEFFTGMSISDEPTGPSADPTAEAWATATAEAQQEEAEAQQDGFDDIENGDANDANAESEENGDALNDDSVDDTEVADDAAQEADDLGTPEPEPTPAEEEIRATAEANQQDHQQFLLDRAGISHDEFVEMFILPDLARQKIQDHLGQDVPTRDEHVEAAHILVATQDAAQVIYEELTENESDFALIAEEQSTDQQTAPNGGDLGWFPRGVMVDEFEEVIFDLEVGEISEPFQSEFGWHIATVTDREDDRPIDLQTLNQRRQQVFQEWLEEQREAADIETDYDLPEDPMPMQDQFQPPAGAPQPPQPEMDPQMEIEQEIPIEDSETDDLFDGDDPFENVEDDD